MLLLFFSMAGFFDRKTPKYRKPQASLKRDGVIEITGDVDTLQRNMHRLASGGTWVHKGQYKWEYHCSHALDKSHQQKIVEVINEATNF